jgi:hypothetical protein
LFEVLSDDLDPTDLPRTIILIVGTFSDSDAKAVSSLAEKVKRLGYLSIIGVKDTVNVQTLDKVADLSYSFNLANGVPNNIQDIILEAHGCNA